MKNNNSRSTKFVIKKLKWNGSNLTLGLPMQ